ncbi:MAG: hypothetical protein Q9157_006899, partial [Trypethelium eluteriae]
MNSPRPGSSHRSPGYPPQSQSRDPPPLRDRNASLSSDSSDSSQLTARSFARKLPYVQGNQSASTTSLHNFSRPTIPLKANDSPLRTQSPALEAPPTPSTQAQIGHRPRQHSQGFFEPSLPSQSNMSNLSASQIAAQAAMHVQNGQHNRKRSTTIPDPRSIQAANTRRQLNSPPPPLPSTKGTPADAVRNTQYNSSGTGGGRFATAGANAAFPRSPASPIDAVSSMPPPPPPPPPPLPQKEAKGKEKSKIKLFSKPKNIGISKEKDDRRPPPLPSPGKSIFGSNLNQSTTSLADSTFSGATSLYSSANASTSTLVPLDKTPTNEKEKHRHHFLSRPKHKKDDFGLTLSSAASNSRPTEPNAPQLYNFAPSSPGPASTFAKSVSGFDLRHGGRALREKKKEEKAAATTANTNLGPGYRPRDQSLNYDASEWPMVSGPDSAGASSFGPPSGGPSVFSLPSDSSVFNAGLTSFGLSGMTSDDAWPLLKARLLNIFEGEDLRTPIEDFNQLVVAHMRRCIQRRTPVVLIEDLRELLQTGFSSLDQTLRKIPDDRLVPHITDIWLNVFTNILPFIQAVFLPLDLEFKGRGSIMSAREAAEFWGVSLPTNDDSNDNIPTLGEELD